MAQFVTAMAVLILLGAGVLVWQLTPQGARGQRAPIVILVLLSLSFLALTPAVEAAFDVIRINAAYLFSHFCSLTAIALTTFYWGHALSATPSSRRRVLATRVVYGAVVIVLVFLFLTSPQQPHGAGFAREFDGSPRIQLYWILQAALMMHASCTLGLVAARASVRERQWRRVLLSILVGVVLMYTVYEMWVIVVVVTWPALPPPWARVLTMVFQIVASLLLVAGSVGPAVLGAFRSTRLARSYIDQLAPLHAWLTQRYPQVRFRRQLGRRAETRVTDMLIEVSDALRLLQRDEPALAAAHGLGDQMIRATAHDNNHCAAYELAVARRFRRPEAPLSYAVA
ncbi:hypothetical protein [Nocardia sp. XZ_19_385]|uniref:hypothetical protein n=1 Tax=Nocardia sp. XZ_19_385 TaxID=2769488 RepID=UPI00188E8B61|nr:hypothetical protein [Nocardia sp. XZ_19_385]